MKHNSSNKFLHSGNTNLAIVFTKSEITNSAMERYRHQMAPWKYLKFEFPAKNFQKSVMWKFIFFSVFISKFGGSHFSFPNSEPRRVLNGKLWPPTWSHRCQDQMLLEGLCMESSFSCFLFENKFFPHFQKHTKRNVT